MNSLNVGRHFFSHILEDLIVLYETILLSSYRIFCLIKLANLKLEIFVRICVVGKFDGVAACDEAAGAATTCDVAPN